MKQDLFLDFETTGLPEFKTPSDDPVQPHIVQMAIIIADTNTQEIKQSVDVIIKPDSWEITQETTDVHGISHEYAMDVGVPEEMAIDLLIAWLYTCDKHVAYNSTFDRRIARIALKRYKDEETMQGLYDHPYECAMIASRKHLGGKNPKLVDAYRDICGKNLIDAHSAMADTLACKEIHYKLQELNAEPGDVFE